mmetsp:Transcript_86746/g.273711  ORF Transcript_86746/g.273711 Transcript_86746/m.273711 type:complete len:204 (-) Transcript_86746:177-788(-)
MLSSSNSGQSCVPKKAFLQEARSSGATQSPLSACRSSSERARANALETLRKEAWPPKGWGSSPCSSHAWPVSSSTGRPCLMKERDSRWCTASRRLGGSVRTRAKSTRPPKWPMPRATRFTGSPPRNWRMLQLASAKAWHASCRRPSSTDVSNSAEWSLFSGTRQRSNNGSFATNHCCSCCTLRWISRETRRTATKCVGRARCG